MKIINAILSNHLMFGEIAALLTLVSIPVLTIIISFI